MKRRPGNRIEGAAGCPSWCRPLRPLFHFLDDVSYPQSVQNVCSGRFYLNLTSLRHTVRGTVVINHAESGAFCLFASSFAIRTRRSRIDQRSAPEKKEKTTDSTSSAGKGRKLPFVLAFSGLTRSTIPTECRAGNPRRVAFKIIHSIYSQRT